MRKKLRVWDTITKRWINILDDVIVCIAGNLYAKNRYDATSLDIETRNIDQFTGMTDINDKEIYENDIVQNEKNEKYIVAYYANLAAFCLLDKSTAIPRYQYLPYRCLGIEVIGNIHENEALIKTYVPDRPDLY